MLGKTHFAIGVAATMAVTRPENISELVLSIGVGGLGALISDIDAEASGSHREADKITFLLVIVVLGVLASDYFFQTDIAERIIKNSGYGRIVLGLLFFISICAFGKEQPHRSFMHSFFAGGLLCLAVGMIWEKAVIYFAIGFLTHVAADIFNKKKVRLLYPMKGGVSLGLFRANGLANSIFFLAGSIAAVWELVSFMARISGMEYWQ